jgi:hypothetical protein
LKNPDVSYDVGEIPFERIKPAFFDNANLVSWCLVRVSGDSILQYALDDTNMSINKASSNFILHKIKHVSELQNEEESMSNVY